MNRRHFLQRAGAGIVSLNAFRTIFSPMARRKQPRIELSWGRGRWKSARLAMGTGTDGVGGSSNQTRKLGLNGLADLFRAGDDQGVTFFDSADQYGTHPHVKEALKSVPRDRVTLLSKTHASTEKEMRADLDRFRRELGADYIDILLLHCMLDDDWPEHKKGAMAVLSEAREKGIIHTHGTSCHTLGALKAAAASPWVEVDLARINPAQKYMDADPQTVLAVLKQMKAAGKGVIGMKILGAGTLRSKADECCNLRWHRIA